MRGRSPRWTAKPHQRCGAEAGTAKSGGYWGCDSGRSAPDTSAFKGQFPTTPSDDVWPLSLGGPYLQHMRPDTLHHYTDQAGFLGITESKGLWATTIHYLNDGAEYRLSADLVRAHAAKRFESTSDDLEGYALQALHAITHNISRSNICVVSFAEHGDLLSQWRGYCSPGDGLSLGLPTACVERSAQALGWRLAKCIYDPDEARGILVELVDRHATRLLVWLRTLASDPGAPDQEPTFSQAWPFAAELSALAPAIKDPSFAEECEWRAISPPISFSDLRYRPGRHTLIPYTELPLVNVENELSRVTVGPTAHPDLAVQAANGRLLHQGFRSHRVAPSAIPFRDW